MEQYLPFTESLVRIVPQLSRQIYIHELDVKDTWGYQDKLKGILAEPKKRRGRTDETIYADVMQGSVAEEGIRQLLNVDLFDDVFDETDRKSYGKDIVADGVRIEVKSHKRQDYFAITEGGYKTLLGNIRERTLDVILFALTEKTENKGWWKVTPTLVVNPYPFKMTFDKLCDTSEFGHVYRADQALPRGLCHLINIDEEIYDSGSDATGEGICASSEGVHSTPAGQGEGLSEPELECCSG